MTRISASTWLEHRIRGALALGLALWVTTSDSMPARACEPGACLHDLPLGDGATNVATDQVFWIAWDATLGEYPLMVTLRDGDDQPVAITVTEEPSGRAALREIKQHLVRVTADAALASSASHTLRASIDEPVCGPERSVTFSAGSLPATPVESYPGGALVEVETAGPGENDCEDQDIERFTYRVTGPEVEAAAYRLYIVDGTELIHVDTALSPELFYEVAAGGPEIARCFVMRAVGMAGDEDDNQVMRCADQPSADDGGPGDAGGSMAADASASSGGGDGGCTCRSGGPTGAGTTLVALAVLGFARRKRRAPWT